LAGAERLPRLQNLRVDGCRIRDCGPLRHAARLLSVSLRDCPIADLEPLAGLGLRRVDVRGCPAEIPPPLRERLREVEPGLWVDPDEKH
jgi:hypothetical protein